MADYFNNEQSRRQFLSKIIPACAITCLGCGSAFASAVSGKGHFSAQEKHNFEEELTMTYEKLFGYRYKSSFIPVFQSIEKDIGKEKLLDMIKKASCRNNEELGKRFAARYSAKNSYNFAAPFRNPGDIFKHAHIYEIIEDTESVFEIKVSACLTAKVFRESDAAEIGYATVCHADFALAEGFNPRIKLIRNKTLMEGDDCCNHRYILET